MSSPVVIRSAVPADADALSRLVCDVLYASNLADYGPANIARVARHFSPEGVAAMLRDRLATWVATQGERIVGTASLDLSQDGQTAVVKTFFVDATLQGAGIAAQRFYEKLGFVAAKDHWDGDERTIEMHR
jgi:GNAT superfamily N-acetyltransferase